MADPLGKARSASLRREASPRWSSPVVGQDVVERQSGVIHCQIPGLPPELQGISVKELVKALGWYHYSISAFLL